MRAVSLVGLALALLLSATSLAEATGASVRVTAQVAPMLAGEVTEDGVTVSSNGSWQLTAVTPEGALIEVNGAPTAGRLVLLPEGSSFYLCMR